MTYLSNSGKSVPKTTAYLRVSTIDQDIEKNKSAILALANHKLLGHVHFVEEKVSGKISWRKRKIADILETSQNGDNIIVSFQVKVYAGVMQDKYPPGRISARLREPATATVVADLTPRVNTKTPRSHNSTGAPADKHGSETRQTQQISGRVKPAIKSEVVRLAKLKGWTVKNRGQPC